MIQSKILEELRSGHTRYNKKKKKHCSLGHISRDTPNIGIIYVIGQYSRFLDTGYTVYQKILDLKVITCLYYFSMFLEVHL